MVILPVSSAQASGELTIMASPRASVSQMQDWARFRGAHEEFINQAQTFYDISIEYGVDPVVTYTQSAKETNFFKFGGVLDITFFNTCGLKTTAGGDNYDPNAHTRFSSWEEGIRAQVEHLALYAGHTNSPFANTVDPRHFPSIKGTAVYVSDLGTRWAPSPTYGDEILDMMSQLIGENLKSQPRPALSQEAIKAMEDKAKLEVEKKATPVVEEPRANPEPDKEVSLTQASLHQEPIFPRPADRVKRLFGANRVETAVMVSKYLDKGSTKRVVLASSTEFTDALLGSVFSSENGVNYPILLSSGKNLDEKTFQEIKTLQPQEIFIIGGNNNIPKSAESQLARATGAKITRIQGANRFETANKIADAFGTSREFILVNSEKFPDALTISPYAAANSIPILLTDGKTLTAETSARLDKASKVTIVGGENSVSKAIEDELKQGGVELRRLSGRDRYETAIMVAKATVKNPHTYILANGRNFADSLVGTSLANEFGAPILLTPKDSLSPFAYKLMGENRPNHIISLGGNASISQAVMVEVDRLIK